MPRRQGYRDPAECQCCHLRIIEIRDLGLLACDRWGVHPAITQPTITKETGQWGQNARRGE